MFEHNKGKIKDNAIKALVKSNLCKHKVFKNKKGKGSYSRKNVKYKNNGCLNGNHYFISKFIFLNLYIVVF